MEINYELKPDDFLQFGKENAPAQKNHQPMVVIFFITYLLFIFADVIYALFSGSLGDWKFDSLLVNIVIRTIITFVVIALVLTIVKLITGKKVNDIVSKEPKNGLFCEHKIILTENELIEITELNDSRYSWKAIGEIKELESFIVVEVLMSFSYLIPKRYFENHQQIKDFVDAAKTYKQNSLLAYSPSFLNASDEKSNSN